MQFPCRLCREDGCFVSGLVQPLFAEGDPVHNACEVALDNPVLGACACKSAAACLQLASNISTGGDAVAEGSLLAEPREHQMLSSSLPAHFYLALRSFFGRHICLRELEPADTARLFPTSLSVEDDERFSVESLALPGSSALAFFLCPHKTAAEITPTALLLHAICHPPCSTVQSTEIFGSCNDGILQKADQRHSLQSGAPAPTKPLSSAPPHVVLAPCAAILKPCQMQLLPCRLGTVASFAFSPAEGRLGKRRHTA